MKVFFALSVTFLFWVPIAPIEAQTSSTITIDYAVDEGPSNQVASGLLHGIGSEKPNQYLIDGIKVNAVRGADYHKNLPSFYEKDIYDRTKETGAELMIGLYYYVVEDSYRPGDNGDWDKWADICKSVYNEAQTNNYEVYSWITWNEPRLQWGDMNKYFEAHHVAYDAVKSLDASAKIQAPEDHAYNFDFMKQFLTFCKEHDCLPDVLAWHELSDNPLDIAGHCSQIKSWMEENDIVPMPMTVTEYQGISYGNDNTSIPGTNVFYLASMERAVKYGFEFGLHACWTRVGDDPEFIPTLADMADRDSASLPRGLWWNYNAYKHMTGKKVGVEVVGGNGDALASTDSIMKRSIALIGTRNYETPHNVSISLINIPEYLIFNNEVNVRVEMIPNAMILMSPEEVISGDFSVSNHSVSLTLPTLEPKASYVVYVSPVTSASYSLSYEAESLIATHSSGSSLNISSESTASGSEYSEFQATENDEYVAYTIPSPGAGVYSLSAILKGGSDHGFTQLYLNGVSVGSPEDQFMEGSEYYINHFGHIQVGAEDLNLRFIIVGKNPAASRKNLGFDKFVLSPLKFETMRIQENETGFCSVEGDISVENDGYTGEGYINTDDASEKGAVWNVNFPESTVYTLSWRYANGESANRTARLDMNGLLSAAQVNFPATGDWAEWSTASVSVHVNSGNNEIRLEALQDGGLAHLDYLEISKIGEVTAQECAGEILSSKTLDDDLIVFPNPANNVVTIKLEENFSQGAVLTLYDQTGRMVMTMQAETNTCSMDLNNVSKGVYMLKISNSLETAYRRISKE